MTIAFKGLYVGFLSALRRAGRDLKRQVSTNTRRSEAVLGMSTYVETCRSPSRFWRSIPVDMLAALAE